MDLEQLTSYEWGIMIPEFIILGVATLLSLLDLFMSRKRNRRFLGWIGIVGIIIAIGFVIAMIGNEPTSILADTFRLDSFAIVSKLLLLIGAGMVLLLAIEYETEREFEEYRGEFYYLFLTGLLGAMFMTSSGDLITLFVGLELLSLSSYILVGLRKRHGRSNEAAMKYVINGGVASAFFLFGVSYVYGLTGTTNLAETFKIHMNGQSNGYILAVAVLIIFVGLSFKLATAPFHMWAPDVYEGAPTPVTAFLSVVSKTAGFIILIRIMVGAFLQAASGDSESPLLLLKLQDYIAFLAGATMIIGNTVALKQKNIKRMLAYSSIAHAGYLLVAFSTYSYFMLDTIWFYLMAYLFMNLGVFAIVQMVIGKSDQEDISQFAGLYKKSPLTALSLTVLLLSLAGFPGTAGFIGKVKIFLGAFSTDTSHYVLASIMIATTVVSYVYYFGVLTQMFFRPPVDDHKVRFPLGILIVVILSIVGTIVFGLMPDLAFEFIRQFDNFGDFLQ